MVLQKVAEEGHLQLTDTLIDDNNTSIKVKPPSRGLLPLLHSLYTSGVSSLSLNGDNKLAAEN